mgnify:CR=1 FL=1
MSWKYYKNGELIKECNDISEIEEDRLSLNISMEDAIIELQENGHDVSDCVLEHATVDDCWFPDYPPEEDEYNEYSLTHTVGRDDIEQTPLQRLFVEPLTDKEIEEWEKVYQILEKEGRTLKVGDDFMDKVWNKAKPSRLTRFKRWCNKWTDKEVSYLIFWIITIYVMIGVIRYEPRMIEIILWPFM